MKPKLAPNHPRATGARLLLLALASATVVATGCGGGGGGGGGKKTPTPTVTAPVIVSQPSSQSVVTGQSATFTVVATGFNLSYAWYAAGTTTPVLSTGPTFTTSTAGSYYVRVTNSAGSVASSTVTLTLVAAETAPVITGQPTSQTVGPGQSGSFTVAATGTNLVYAWYAANTNTPILSSSATFTTSTAGTYYATVRNSLGFVATNAVTLTVTPNAPTTGDSTVTVN